MEGKDQILRIRCTKETLIRFKKVAAEFRTYEDCLKKLLEVYEDTRRVGWR